MKNVLIMPVLAVALFAAACGDDGPAAPDTRPMVRFVNVTTGMTGSGGFTTNGQFESGSAVAFGQSTQTCSKVTPGVTAFGFGAANTGGTGLSGNALATLNNQTLIDGGNYTLVAFGYATNPQLYMFDNSFSGTLSSTQAAVRLANLSPGTETVPNNFAVFRGVFEAGGTLMINNPGVGTVTAFEMVTSGANTYSLLRNHIVPLDVPQVTFTLQAGTANTIAIVPTTGATSQLINLPRCS